MRLVACFDARDPVGVAGFWAELLERQVVRDARGPLVPGDHGQLGLRFVASPAEKTRQNRTHPHLTSDSPEHQQQTVARALELGARHVDVGQRPEEEHIVLADPEGNEFCVIEPGNRFLEGCGFLGELSCEGTRAIGLFWSAALGWPLVWDQDEETAVQSPQGGTKVSWGGEPVETQWRGDRQRLEVAAEHLEAEADRLVSLGATRANEAPAGVVVLADPDGNELWLTTAGAGG